MTIEKVMERRLEEYGFFPEQAAAVMGMVKAAPENAEMAKRWGDDVSACPEALMYVLWISVKDAALGYIDKECPGAWFRAMFV